MTKKKQQKYADAIRELEHIISEIENETIDVDELTKKVKRASELITFCKEKLSKTEREVKNVLDDFAEEEEVYEESEEKDPEGLF